MYVPNSSSSKPPNLPRESKGKEREGRPAKQPRNTSLPRNIGKIITHAEGSYKPKRRISGIPELEEISPQANADLQVREEIRSQQFLPPLKWLPDALKERIQRKELELIQKKQRASSPKQEPSSMPTPAFSADPLGDSANPVGVLKKPIYIPRSFVTEANYPTNTMLLDIIKRAYISATGPESRKAAKQRMLMELQRQFLSIYKTEIPESEKFFMAMEAFAHFKSVNNSKDDPFGFRKGILQIEKEFEAISPFKLEAVQKIPVLFKRDEIINQLRILLQPKKGENLPSEEADKIIRLIQKLNQNQDSYICKEDLETNFPEIEDFSHAPFKEYVSSFDVQAMLGNNSLVKAIIQKAQGSEHNPGYAVKLGNENRRELLGRKLLVVLGFEKFFHIKTGVDLPDTTIKGRIANNAIGSSLIEDATINRKWHEAWKNYQKVELQLKKAIYENQPVALIDNLQIRRDRAATKLEKLGGAKSIPQIVLLSALLGGYDEHLGQFVLGDEFTDIDFSRYLPPSPYLIKGDETFFIFRNVFLNHPFAKEPLPREVVNMISDWDLQTMQEDIGKLTGNQAEMECDYEKLRAINEEISLIREYKEALSEKETEECMRKLQPLLIHYKVSERDSDPVNTLIRRVIREQNRIRQKNFNVIHFQAAKDLLIRMAILQEYVKTPTPSAYGAFKVMYPEIVPFIDYLEHSLTEVGEEISMKLVAGATRIKSLESIVQHAERFLKSRYVFEDAPKNEEEAKERVLADEKLLREINAMKASLEAMKARARFRDELGLTMDLS